MSWPLIGDSGVDQLPDAENAHRTWLRNKVDLVGDRVFFTFPSDTALRLPDKRALITLQRTGGAPQRGEALLDDLRLDYDVWALNKKDASTATRSLVSLLRSTAGILLDDSTRLYGVEIEAVLWVPDNEAKLARYVVTGTSTVR
jgi:hypothetical protein